jgi:predicted RNA binding protein YcfA (HicA-like mRNA interferase family)
MKQISGKELARIIQKRGWILVRSKVSHHIFTNDGRQERIVIPIHGNQPLKIGLLRSLMKVAELTDGDLQ